MHGITSVESDQVPRFVLNGQVVHGSQAMLVDCGDVSLLYTSGQVAPSGPAGRGDIADQVHAVMTQLRALMVAAGGGMEHVVKLTAWVTRREDVPVYATIRRGYLDHAPASTSVIAELIEPDMLIEVEAIAAIPKGDRAV
jgi:enamine deaminase RidA (YjgF/YER057c/UK114 family)